MTEHEGPLTADVMDGLCEDFRAYLGRKRQDSIKGQIDDQLDHLIDQIAELSTAVETANVPDLAIDSVRFAEELRHSIATYEAAVRDLDLAGLASSREIYQLSQSVSGVRDGLRIRISEAWKDFTSGDSVPDVARFAPLVETALKPSEAVAIGNLPGKLERLARKAIPDADDVSQYVKGRERLALLTAKLQSALEAENGRMATNPAVLAFNSAVDDGGATIEMLTKEVRDWIDSQGASSDYRVVRPDW